MTYDPRPDPVTRARFFAVIAHAGQVYSDEVPYEVHLDNVVRILKDFGATHPDMLCAGFLHDTIEDTKVSYNDIKERFGEDVAELVYAVTDERGRNRRERHEKTYPKVKATVGATVLKLADRIANVEYGLKSGAGKSGMYRSEFNDFMRGVYIQRHPETEYSFIADGMWHYLANLLGKTNELVAFKAEVQS